ncbi:MAG: hypothetical protein AB4290_25190 [Spirulina sp.]
MSQFITWKARSLARKIQWGRRSVLLRASKSSVNVKHFKNLAINLSSR